MGLSEQLILILDGTPQCFAAAIIDMQSGELAVACGRPGADPKRLGPLALVARTLLEGAGLPAGGVVESIVESRGAVHVLRRITDSRFALLVTCDATVNLGVVLGQVRKAAAACKTCA